MSDFDLDHVAIAAHHIADAAPFLAGELGGRSGYGGPSREFRWWHWDYAGGGRIEVIEPLGPAGGFVHRFLDRLGPGIHHVTFKVPDLARACERAGELGYDVVGFDDSDPAWKEAFLHPKQAMGIVIQLVEPGRLGGAGPPRDDPPPAPADPPPPVEVVGIRMVTDDREAALRQWGSLLGGRLEEGKGALQFHWPSSPMRVAVTLERGAVSHSHSIELRTDRPLRLPSGPHPVLGARFRLIRD